MTPPTIKTFPIQRLKQRITTSPQIDGSADDLGSDVGSTEALLATHRELKEAVDGEREEVDKFVGIGRGLIEEENCDKDEVRDDEITN